jgi:hypothetical protein
MSRTDTPSWDELLEAGTYTSAQAAAMRGVSQAAAKQAARSRGKKWRSNFRKITDDEIRTAARDGQHVREVAERHGMTVVAVWRRVSAIPDVSTERGWLSVAEAADSTAAPRRGKLSANPAAIERYLAKGGQACRSA